MYNHHNARNLSAGHHRDTAGLPANHNTSVPAGHVGDTAELHVDHDHDDGEPTTHHNVVLARNNDASDNNRCDYNGGYYDGSGNNTDYDYDSDIAVAAVGTSTAG